MDQQQQLINRSHQKKLVTVSDIKTAVSERLLKACGFQIQKNLLSGKYHVHDIACERTCSCNCNSIPGHCGTCSRNFDECFFRDVDWNYNIFRSLNVSKCLLCRFQKRPTDASSTPATKKVTHIIFIFLIIYFCTILLLLPA